MSEENKTVELKDDELEKVSGGAGITINSIDYGDYFENISFYLYALNTYSVIDDTTKIEFDMYKKNDNSFVAKVSYLRVDIDGCFFYNGTKNNKNYIQHS